MSHPEEDELIGRVLLDRLQVIRRIGGGGMGSVYEVEHKLTGHRRALKLVRKRHANEPRFMKRLLREARVAGTLSSPYVVETLDAGRLEDGSAYVLMELLKGRSLLDLLRDKGVLEPEEVAWIGAQVCEGLRAAHGAEIIHRDLKPDNIFVVPTADEHALVKILDFGVSKFANLADEPDRLTREGTILGTPYYMSPEQASGRKLDPRTDLYALGVVMYEALCGRLPFEANTVGALFMKIGGGEYIPLDYRRPELDEELVALVHKSIHRDPKERFQDASEMQEALLPFCDGTLQSPGRTTRRLAYMAQKDRDRLETVEFGTPEDRKHLPDSDEGPATIASVKSSPSSVPPPRTPSSFPPVPSSIGSAVTPSPPTGELIQRPEDIEALLSEQAVQQARSTPPPAKSPKAAPRRVMPIALATIVVLGAVALVLIIPGAGDDSEAEVDETPLLETPPPTPESENEPIPIEAIELVAPLEQEQPAAQTMEAQAPPEAPSESEATAQTRPSKMVGSMRVRPRSETVGLDQNPY